MARYSVVYYRSRAGSTPVEKFLDKLSDDALAKCIDYLDLLEASGLSLKRSHLKWVDRDLWELRPEWAGVEYRLYFTQTGVTFIILDAMKKPGNDKIPPHIKKRLLKRVKEVQDDYAATTRNKP